MKLESKISPQPNAAVRVTFSSKKKTPIKTPKIIREYLNGVIADTSPIRIAEMMALYPVVPNTIPIRRKSQELISGQENRFVIKQSVVRYQRALLTKSRGVRVQKY